jgi:Arc/MetJ-type ribon-helix-helix transcriptional regulator
MGRNLSNTSGATKMAKVSISIPDDLLAYIDQKVDNRSALLESLIQHWQAQQEDQALADACELVDRLGLGWDETCQNAMTTDWEVSG